MSTKFNRGYRGETILASQASASGFHNIQEQSLSKKESKWPAVPIIVSAADSGGAYTYAEGTAIQVTVTTQNVLDGTNLHWTIVGTGSAPMTSADFLGGVMAGTVTINSNTGTASLPVPNPVDTEGDEYMYVAIGFVAGQNVVQTPTYTITDATGPVLSIEYVAGSYSWVDGTTLSRVNSATRDDGYYGPWSIGFDFPFGGTNYNNNVYNATNGYITFGNAYSQITNSYSQSSHPNKIYGYPRDMYQGFSTNWGIHGSGNGSGHGVFVKSQYTPTGASATYCKAWIISLGQTTYTNTYRGQNFSQTYILVSDAVSNLGTGKTWIEVCHYGVGNAGNYFPQTGMRVNNTNVGGGNMSSIGNNSIVYEGDNSGQNFVYKGLGKLRVMGTSNWVFGAPGAT